MADLGQAARQKEPRRALCGDGQLGVDRFCSPTELKDAYKKKSLALHPDKQIDATDEEKVKAEEEYHKVQKAYDILTEPATRQAYDKARSEPRATRRPARRRRAPCEAHAARRAARGARAGRGARAPA